MRVPHGSVSLGEALTACTIPFYNGYKFEYLSVRERTKLSENAMQLVKNISTLIFWAFIIALSLYFFLDNVVAFLFGYRSKNFGTTLFNNQLWVVAHLIGGSLALLLGPVQFWQSVRTRYLNFHRISGKIYIAGCTLAGLSALRLSVTSPCVPCRISLLLLAVAVLFTTGAAWYTIRHKNIKAHRQFMVRSYTTVLAFVAVRINDIISLSFLFGTIPDPTFNRTVNEYFFSFVPLLIAEVFLTWLPALKASKPSRKVAKI